MASSDYFLKPVNVFQAKELPVNVQPAGYAALLEGFALKVPSSLHRLAGIHPHNTRVDSPDFLLLTPGHAPANNLAGHLEFALKWEGVNLSVLAALFKTLPPNDVREVVREKPTGIYRRRIWFLYEWLTGSILDLPNAGKVRSVLAVNPEQQLALNTGELSSRHSVTNNLPGTAEFCPMVRRTPVLESFLHKQLHLRAREVLGRTHPDIVSRAAAFLLLSDSRASFGIEGENPSNNRAARWGQAISQAGTISLTTGELESLQKMVVGDSKFVRLGLRTEGGFVGIHDRVTQQPIPDHISARADDLKSLMSGVVAYDDRAVAGEIDPVAAAAALAFGFVYIHPFEDGNGRIHRWLIHHVLARAGYNPHGLVFPVSAVMLRELNMYRKVLESYSKPLLQYINWQPTNSGNVEVLNQTSDYYRYFDATVHAEFLYHCVESTIEHDLPDEVKYLEGYDQFARKVQSIVDMPARTTDLLHSFLHQGNGQLSKRAREKEFRALSDVEVEKIEQLYTECVQ